MRRSLAAQIGFWVALVVLALFVLFPLYMMITSSLKPLSEVTLGTLYPHIVDWSPWVQMWQTIPLGRYFINSLIVSICATAISLLIAIFASYAFARLPFFGKNAFGTLILSTQMFPGVLFLLPLYLIFVVVQGWTGLPFRGTYLGLILTYLTFALPFSIWMLRGYLESVPRDLEESALVDGCTPVQSLFRVVLPVALPGVIAVGIFAFLNSWNEILFASVLTNAQTRTLSIGLQSYATQQQVFWNQMMAASILATLPIVIGFLFVQRYIVQGLTAGAVK
ncbi:MAG: carbohydrate ABC transporter permease [Firmicutes bacterium]|nr:carbohydrate ABC transporter permease [Bacillota bacterium]